MTEPSLLPLFDPPHAEEPGQSRSGLHDLVAPDALLGVAHAFALPSVEGPDGREHDNPLQGAVASILTLDEMGAEPARGEFTTRAEYEDAVDRWFADQESVYAEMVETVAKVAAALREVARIETGRVPAPR